MQPPISYLFHEMSVDRMRFRRSLERESNSVPWMNLSGPMLTIGLFPTSVSYSTDAPMQSCRSISLNR